MIWLEKIPAYRHNFNKKFDYFYIFDEFSWISTDYQYFAVDFEGMVIEFSKWVSPMLVGQLV